VALALLAASPALSPHELAAFNLTATTAATATVVLRLVPLVEQIGAAQTALEGVLDPSAAATWLPALGAHLAAATIAFTAATVVRAAAAPGGLTSFALSSASARLLWGFPAQTQALLGFEIHLLHQATGRVQVLNSSVAPVDVPLAHGSGEYLVRVYSIYGPGAVEPGRSAPVALTITAPACATGCSLCTALACQACDNSTLPFALSGGVCLLPSTDKANCLALGSSALCGINMIALILGLVIVGLAVLLFLYCACTRRNVAVKHHHQATDNLEIKEVRFVPKWSQRGDRYT
jgi:hypothetical protein